MTAAIMAKVFYLSLLVLLLMTCSVTPKRVACLKQVRPQTHEQKMDILKCLCRKHHLGCFALWCLPVFVCKTTQAVGACPCLAILDCIGCVPSASLAMRATVRQRYGIKGNVWSDCFYGCCCYALSWCQISREMKRRALRP